MKQDKYGQYILSESDIVDSIMSDRQLNQCYVDVPVDFKNLELDNIPEFKQYQDPMLSIEDFDSMCQKNWFMPAEYKNLDIAAWVLDQCKTDEQRQRAGEELLLYLDRDLFPLLQYLKYLVDTMRQNNILWGVGRGSSVASYVLYLIGIHRIDSLYFSLDIREFLR